MNDDFETFSRSVGGWLDARVGRDEAVDPEQLLAHPDNYRIHTRRQERSMVDILEQFGWVRDVLVNRRTGRIIDGHLRVSIAITHGQTVPVSYVDVDEATERKMIAVIDAVARQALMDRDRFEDLVADWPDPTPGIQNLIADTLPDTKAIDDTLDKGDDDETIDTDPVPDVMYAVVGWSETKVRTTTEAIADLTILHNKWRADHDGTDDGFIEWLIRNHDD